MKLVRGKLTKMNFWYRSDDKFVGQRIALGKYEEFETKLMLSQIDSNSVVVDVGANIGYYTLLLAKRCKKVYAIEPEAESFKILQKNVEENKLKNVVLIKGAAGEVQEKRKLITDRNNFGNHRFNPPKSPFNKGDLRQFTRTANVLRLDDILRYEQKIDLIKIDTQGWEPQVINGAKKIIERHSPTLFLEYSPNDYKDDSMMKFLKRIYKNIWSIDYWFYIGRPGVWVDKKTGYVDLFLKEKMGFGDHWRMIKEIQIRKVMKWIANCIINYE